MTAVAKDKGINNQQENYQIPLESSLASSKKISIRKSNQTVSPISRKIKVNRKGWTIRAITIIILVSLIALYIYYGLTNPKGNFIMIYTSIIISISIIIYIFSWIFYRNPTTPSNTTHNYLSSLYHLDSNLNNKEVLVSVIIPIYNQNKLIENVIDSVFNSTYKNIEVIAVNDGSIDGTDKILDYLKVHRYPQLKVIHKSNGGKRKAVSSGFMRSQGQYIILMDSDSIIDNNAISEFVKVFDSESSVGSVAGHTKIWNADKNFITKCQDSWYDFEHNVFKSCESYFGNVTCCSGCLAGYRRKAIESIMSIWNSENNYLNDKNKLKIENIVLEERKSSNKIKECMLSFFISIQNNLLVNLLDYDDSEDRCLTTCCLFKWKSVYLSTALVFTEAPDTIKNYLKQQKRWKKGYLRASMFASTFFYKKKNPVISLLFYTGFIMAIISPIITPLALLYNVFVLHEMIAPLSLIGGFLAIGFLEGIDYKMRDNNSTNWFYKPIMNLLLSFIVSWLIFSAILNIRKNVWLTR
jgi:hyaluronan synthase